MKKKRLKCGHFNIERSCSECLKLLAKWNEKIEFPEELKRCGVVLWDKDRISYSQTIAADYYEQLRLAAEREEFENQIHELIMKMRSEGKKISEIVAGLKKKRKRIHRETVRHVIRRFEHKWKVREWTPKQMNLKAPIESSSSPQFLSRPNIKI